MNRLPGDVGDTARSIGFVVGHITPEAQRGDNIVLIKNGDPITIDAKKK